MTDFTYLETALTVVIFLTAAAVVLFLDHLRKERLLHLAHGMETPAHTLPAGHEIKTSETAEPPVSAPMLATAPPNYGVMRRVDAERPLDSSIAITTSRPPVLPRMNPDIVRVEMAPPSPVAPLHAAGLQLGGNSHANSFSSELPPITIDAALWEQLVQSRPRCDFPTAAGHGLKSSGMAAASPALRPAKESIVTIEANRRMIQEIVPVVQASGMIQLPALERMLESAEPFTGLVISIGINDSDSSIWHRHGAMQSIGAFIATLLNENEFSCRTAYDEFLMVCPGERGAQSQRRLNHISERLWDYQLRGMGANSILFSWGGAQVQDRLLSAAVATATERMRETKRSGNSAHCLVAHPPSFRRCTSEVV